MAADLGDEAAAELRRGGSEGRRNAGLVEDGLIGSRERVPEIDPQIGKDRDRTDVGLVLQPEADPSCPVAGRVVVDGREGILGLVVAQALPDDLGLGLEGPAVAEVNGIAALQRQGVILSHAAEADPPL